MSVCISLCPRGCRRRRYVKEDYYTTNFFSDYAVQRIAQRNTSNPIWLHLTYQAVHTGTGRAPPVWERWDGDQDYISAMSVRVRVMGKGGGRANRDTALNMYVLVDLQFHKL
jgi:hypothetical protein